MAICSFTQMYMNGYVMSTVIDDAEVGELTVTDKNPFSSKNYRVKRDL